MMVSHWKKNIPNILSSSRFVFAIMFPIVPFSWRLPLLLVSLLTEYLDGALSRWFNWGSPLGALLDPMADKVFIFSVAITLFMTSEMAGYEFFLFGARDLVVFLGSIAVAMRGNWKAFFNVRPRLLGKITTALQFFSFFDFFVFGHFHWYLLYTTIALSIFSGMDYLYLLFKNKMYENI